MIDLDAQHVVQTYGRAPFVLARGAGVTLYDTEGKTYLDWVAGIAVNALGYGDPELAQVISAQAGQLIHVSNLYYNAPQAELAARLCELSFADRVFFNNSGSEANETAIKFARKWARAKGRRGKTQIVAFSNAFHGRTMGALALTPRDKYQKPFEPLMPDVVIAPFNDIDTAAQAIGAETCAVFVEPVQGEGGVHEAIPEFLAALRELTQRHDAALVFDEVQCGVGRTGTLWAHEFSGITPDIMTLAKPLAGGLPIGAALVTDTVASAITIGDHGSTFAGGPLVCQAALTVLNRVAQPEFLAHVREVGMYLQEGLSQLASPLIRAVRGRGLMVGLELSIPASDVVRAGYEHGLILVNAGPDVIRFVPPLIVETRHVDTLLERLEVILNGES
ncbi:MAG: aspartate aminotransferase family protein [Anaerolineae bacterium]|nr:aspartate aminotransferase family protein [Anaerolineae bacterium]